MQKSTCYRLIKPKEIGVEGYVLTPSWLEIFKDTNGKEFRIHFHKIEVAPGIFKWSATEESTGLKCSAIDRDTRSEVYDYMLQLIPKLNDIMKRHTHYIDRMREFKEKNNIK